MRFLKSLPLFIGLGALAVSAAAPAHAGSAQSYTVELNKTEIVRLPGAAVGFSRQYDDGCEFAGRKYIIQSRCQTL